MTGRHASGAVVAQPEALAQLEQMLDTSTRTDPARARALQVAHRRRAITWDVYTTPAAHGRVVVPWWGGLHLSQCSAQLRRTGYICTRVKGHGGRHHAAALGATGEMCQVYAVWSGGAR